MARQKDDETYDERRRQIMDGALDVFSRKGFEKATNREIAEAAGIGSPGLIYHYFKDKADLLRTLIEDRVPLLQLIGHHDELMALPPEEALGRVGRSYFRLMEMPQAIAMLKLMIGESSRRPKVAQFFNELGPNRVMGFLAEYLAAQMEAGTLRREDPAMAARCFFGPLVAFVLTRELFRQPDAQQLDPDAFLETNLRVFLRGMRPEGN